MSRLDDYMEQEVARLQQENSELETLVRVLERQCHYAQRDALKAIDKALTRIKSLEETAEMYKARAAFEPEINTARREVETVAGKVSGGPWS